MVWTVHLLLFFFISHCYIFISHFYFVIFVIKHDSIFYVSLCCQPTELIWAFLFDKFFNFSPRPTALAYSTQEEEEMAGSTSRKQGRKKAGWWSSHRMKSKQTAAADREQTQSAIFNKQNNWSLLFYEVCTILSLSPPPPLLTLGS